MNLIFQISQAAPVDNFNPVWGTFPDWLTFVVAFCGVLSATMQLRHLRYDRETENILNIANSIVTHNSDVSKDDNQLNAISNILSLSIPHNDEDIEKYWATRLVHLNHINLIWRVWEVGKKKSSKTLILQDRFDGWTRFAEYIVARKLWDAEMERINGSNKPDVLAGSDLWRALDSYEPFSTEFVYWLKQLKERQ